MWVGFLLPLMASVAICTVANRVLQRRLENGRLRLSVAGIILALVGGMLWLISMAISGATTGMGDAGLLVIFSWLTVLWFMDARRAYRYIASKRHRL
jgi:hypothetical protein